MNFKYQKFPVDVNNCPFPNKKSSLRPVIRIDFETEDKHFGYMEQMAYGILGQDGFFNDWIIKFEYTKENIELKKI